MIRISPIGNLALEPAKRTEKRARNGEIAMRASVLFLLFSTAVAYAGDKVSFFNEGVIDAPIEEVWKVFSTSEGYKVMGSALAEVDLRIGGTIRSRYGADGTLGDAETIETAILAYEPPTMMATRILRIPESFPFKSAWKNPWTVVTLTPIDTGKTQVRVASLGFGSDEESVAMRAFFEAGNPQVIETIRRHFAADSAR
jgi:uncharacterized protein YndB with AHSA1/START domain